MRTHNAANKECINTLKPPQNKLTSTTFLQNTRGTRFTQALSFLADNTTQEETISCDVKVVVYSLLDRKVMFNITSDFKNDLTKKIRLRDSYL